MRWGSPGQKSFDTVLEDKDYSDSVTVLSNGRALALGIVYLALNRRKLFVIRGSEKLGRLIYFDDRTSGGRPNSSTSSFGMTCCRSLR